MVVSASILNGLLTQFFHCGFAVCLVASHRIVVEVAHVESNPPKTVWLSPGTMVLRVRETSMCFDIEIVVMFSKPRMSWGNAYVAIRVTHFVSFQSEQRSGK